MIKKLCFYSLLLIVIFHSSYGLDRTPYNVTSLNNPAPGYLFADQIGTDAMSMVDNAGQLINQGYQGSSNSMFSNFRALSNGHLVAFRHTSPTWIIFDENFDIVDSVKVPSPMNTDFHDIILLANGNYLLIGSDEIYVDMSLKVQNGNQHATILDWSLIEVNSANNVVFQWRLSDHFDVTDATEDIDLTQRVIDPFHINSINEDSDGNLIISSRHMDEVTKINKQTGAIIWRIGGTACRNNQFTFTNDTYQNYTGFSHQHDAHILPNGHLILFDNGNLKPTPYSRAVEYVLNTSNMTATKVFEYRNSPDIYVETMGNVQRLPNGNTLIGWTGGDLANTHLVATEVTSSGTKVFEISHPTYISYRVTRSVFMMDAVSQTISSSGQFGFNDAKYKTGLSLNIQTIRGSATVSVEKHAYMPYNRSFTTEAPPLTLPYRWVINQLGISSVSGKVSISTATDVLGDIVHPEWLQIYIRSTENNGTFSPLTTTYNSTTKLLEANISGFGEIMVGYKEYFSPKLSLPQNTSYGQPTNTTLKWERISPDDMYILQVSPSPDFSTLIVEQNNLNDNQFSTSNLSNLTDYFWRVKSFSSLYTSSWSTVFKFQTIVGKPTHVTPNNAQTEIQTSGRLIWTSVNGAINYRLQVADNPDFILPKIDVTISSSVRYDYKDLDNYTNYYWRICASNRDIFGAWSDVWQFQTIMSIPKLTFPANKSSAIQTTGIFQWDIVNGATMYSLQVSTDSAYQNVIINETGIHSNQLNYQNLNAVTGYYWHVKALNNNTKTEWSPSSYFFTILPATNLIIPKDNAGNIATKAVYSWESVQGASEYQIEIAEDSLFTIMHHTKKFSGTSYTCTDLKYNTKYYWRVKAYKQANEGDWSAVRKFKTIEQYAVTFPDLSLPADNSYKVPVNANLAWEIAYNAATYNIEVASDDKFSSKVYTESVIPETNATVDKLEYNHKYYWHVQACNNTNCSEWSDSWYFTTQLASSKLVEPSDKQTDIKLNCTLLWEPVDGGMFYWLEIATDNEFKNLIIDKDNLTELSYSPENLAQLTTYYWRIHPRNVNNSGDWSEVRSFVTGKIASVEENQEISRIYPNPASDFIYLENINFNSLQIFDAIGNLVLSSNDPLTKIDISNLTNGIYNLRTFAGNSSQTFKLVIIR